MLMTSINVVFSFEQSARSAIALLGKPLVSAWTFTWVEWVLLQTLVTYTFVRLYNTNNYLKQIMFLVMLLIYVCLNAALWQFELFACFLFLGEFTIFIFFFCLLLHLRASVNQTHNETAPLWYSAVACVIFVSTWYVGLVWAEYLSVPFDLSLLFLDLYRVTTDCTLNDLVFLYYFFVFANLSVHFFIGVTLFLLTLFLFTTVNVYAGSNLSKQSVLRKNLDKLNTPRAYYEQSGHYSQKSFSFKNDDNS